MKKPLSVSVSCSIAVAAACLVLAESALAQDRMYRCDNNYYTNSLTDPKAQGCKALEGGNVTIVQGTRPVVAQNGVKLAAVSPGISNPGVKVDANDQRSRDSDAKVILESELKKAEARKADLAREFNNGEPEKRGDEARNFQKYQDRVAELKANLMRIESDIAGIRRELGRAAGGNGLNLSSGAK